MSMRMLIDGELGAYFDASRTAGSLWIFQHVPKTAGSSLRREVAQALRKLGPEANIHIDWTDPTIPHHEKMDRAVNGFLARAESIPFLFASGHLFARHIEQIRKSHARTKVFTFMRDPVERYISDYRYQRTDMHPESPAFRAEFPTIESFMDSKRAANSMAHYLLPPDVRKSENAGRAANYLLDNFEFIGIQNYYEPSFRALCALIGIDRKPTVKERLNPVTDENPAPTSPEILQKIRDLNAFDQELYDILSTKIRSAFERIPERPPS